MIVLGRLIVGLGMLVLGRQLFWLFVGGVGFVFGIQLATQVLGEGQPDVNILLFALVFGFIGAVVALALQKLAVSAAGFFGGGVIAMNLVQVMNLDLGSVLVPFLVGGVLGLILVSILFDWALIAISSFAGATVIVQSFVMETAVSLLLLVILIAVGIAVQANQLRREGKKG
ncbi:MAG: hypothetical protein H6667_18295 [Ardenticatenaceae bacterium]|nr:hypothetical protein [Ardenticatenaceae bacterium]MCB9445776.1 hypothetical protein [Ardenticatenaceae bacterium]